MSMVDEPDGRPPTWEKPTMKTGASEAARRPRRDRAANRTGGRAGPKAPARPKPDDTTVWVPGRPFLTGPLTVRPASNDPQVVERLDRLFVAMPDVAPPSGTTQIPEVEVKVWAYEHPAGEKAERWYETMIAGQVRVQSRRMGRHEEGFTERLNRLVLDADPGHLHLHAGVVSRPDGGVLLVGPKGAGKSTLVAHLVRRGWTYCTDEMTALTAGPPGLTPFPRPVSLKRGSWDLFADLPSVAEAIELGSLKRVEVPPAELGASVPSLDAVLPLVIVQVSFEVDSEVRFERLSRLEAMAALIGDTLDLERAGPEGMRALLELAATVTAFRLTYPDFARVDPLVDEMLREAAGAKTSSVVSHGAGPVVDEADVPAVRRAPGVEAWGFDDEPGALLYEPDVGVVARLDERGLALWHILEVPRHFDELAELVGATDDGSRAVLRDFLDVLAHQDLLRVG